MTVAPTPTSAAIPVGDFPSTRRPKGSITQCMSLAARDEPNTPIVTTLEAMSSRVEELEQQLEAQERDAEQRVKLLAHLSHELRTPMSAVLGMIDLLLDTAPTDQQREMLLVSKQASDELLTLINDILDLSKLDANGMRLEEMPFDLVDVVGRVLSTLRPLATEKNIFLASDIPIGLPQRVIGDPGRLRQILVNLVGNAIKFTDEGSVVVGIRIVSSGAHHATIRIDVADTGTGIPGDRLEAIFDPYEQAADSTTRTHGGTGLGLAICRQLADLMDGRLTVTSTVGRGSTFSLVIGFATRPSDEATIHDVTPATQAVVLSAEAQLESLRELVDEIGLTPIGSPETADDVIIIDLDHFGFGRIMTIRADHPENPMLIITTSGQRGDAAKSQEIGVAGYLTRPIDADELATAIEAARQGVEQLITRHWLREQQPKRSVLLVEDDEVNRQVTIHMLEQLDFAVYGVGTATDGLEALEARPFDLVISDLGLPDMDGTDFLQAVGDIVDIPAIVATGRVDEASINAAFAVGAAAVLRKPFDVNELGEGIEAVLSARAGA